MRRAKDGCLTSCLTACDNGVIGCWERAFAPTPIDYDAIAPQLKTGDLFLATACRAGRNSPGQFTISSSPWDHAGIIWREGEELYIIDSCASRYYGNLSRRPLHFGEGAAPSVSAWKLEGGDGPQMMSLRGFIDEQATRPIETSGGTAPWWCSRLGVRPLATPLCADELERVRVSIEALRDMPFQKDDEAVNAAIDLCDCIGLTRNKETRSSLFCSEFVALVYQDAGLLPKEPPGSEYVPADFSLYHGSNCTAFCGCCCLSYLLSSCGVGDLRRDAGSDAGAGKLFAEEIVLKSHPPPSSPTSLGRVKRGRDRGSQAIRL